MVLLLRLESELVRRFRLSWALYLTSLFPSSNLLQAQTYFLTPTSGTFYIICRSLNRGALLLATSIQTGFQNSSEQQDL